MKTGRVKTLTVEVFFVVLHDGLDGKNIAGNNQNFPSRPRQYTSAGEKDSFKTASLSRGDTLNVAERPFFQRVIRS